MYFVRKFVLQLERPAYFTLLESKAIVLLSAVEGKKQNNTSAKHHNFLFYK